jgi:hypothetical protein
MPEPASKRLLWTPRHRGWKLAHHLLPAFVLALFLLALGVASGVLGNWLFAVPMLALAAGTAGSILRAFRRSNTDELPCTSAVETSTGRRAATRFPMVPVSVPLGASTVGLGVVTAVAALALAARYLLLHTEASRYLVVAASAVLLVVGLAILRRGLRLMRTAASREPAGVYLTRSRVVLLAPHDMREAYWRDVESVSAENPPRRAPLGKRGPALVVVRLRPGAAADTESAMVVHVQHLSCDPHVLLRALEHYMSHPADRPELGTPAALSRVGGHG